MLVLTVVVLSAPYLAFAWFDDQSSLKNVRDILQENEGDENICLHSIEELLKNHELELLYMLDATGKLQPGIMKGNLHSLGDYDECIGIKTKGESPIYGKYCSTGLDLVTFIERLSKIFRIDEIHPDFLKNSNDKKNYLDSNPMPTQLKIINPQTSGYDIIWGICIPHTCTAKDIQKYFDLRTIHDDFCYTDNDDLKLSSLAIGGIVFFAMIVALAIASTAYDFYLYWNEISEPKHEIFLAFSVISNGKKLMSCSKNPNVISCLYGMRVLSMMWVLIGHEYGFRIMWPSTNLFDLVFNWKKHASNMIIISGTLSVDTFFAMTGIVTTYSYFQSPDLGVRKNIRKVPWLYLHRYLRLTPALAVLVFIYVSIYPYIGSGPLWSLLKEQNDACHRSWWTTLLYIQNYFELSDICGPHAWYLAVDMQLFILSPLVLIPFRRKSKYGLYILGFLTILGIIIPASLAYTKKLNAFPTSLSMDYMKYYYMQTYARFGPYVIGMIFGYLIHQVRTSSVKIPRSNALHQLLIWLFLVGAMLVCIYGGFDIMNTEYSRWGNTLYIAFNRQIWSLIVCVLVFLCATGNGDLIKWILSLPVFQFLSKLSYSMYLIHYVVLQVRLSSVKQGSEITNYSMAFEFWGDYMTTLGISIIFCLLFESPIITIEKILFGRMKK